MMHFNRVRVLFSDHLNIARGKYLPAEVAKRGVSRHCLSLFALGYDRQMTPATGAMMLEGLPDLEAVFDPDDVRASWEPGTGVVIADLQRDAQPLPLCPRNALRRAVEAWRALGYWPKVGVEFEAYIFQRGESGEWVPYDTPGAYVYGTGAAVDPAGLIDDIWAQSEACGFPLEFINSEYDYPQFEFTMSYDDALAAVDDAFLFRLMAREVAIRRGYRLSYMPKPINGRSGNGLHFNFSLADGSGNNRMADPDAEDGLSELARQCLAGLVAHHEGMTALLAPTVNSYRRLRPAQLTPYWANWGYDHRGTAVRVPGERGRGTRLEHRLADGAANLYVGAAAVLQAAHLGTVEKPELPPAETADGLETASTDRVVPENLGAALKVLQQDQSLVDAVGSELVAHFCDIKQAEWERFLGYTTDWEINEYRDFL
jgi:glutamine synthetase